MKTNNTIYMIAVFMSLGLSSFSQTNLIVNGSFENGTRSDVDCYSKNGPLQSGNESLNGCAGWSTALTDPTYCNSSNTASCLSADWVDPNNCFSNTTFLNMTGLPPLAGLNGKCAGMVKTSSGFVEGVRASLNRSLKNGGYYQLKLRMAVSAQSIPKSSSIRIHFTKFSQYWNASTTLSTNAKLENVHSFVISPNSSHIWYEFTHNFKVTDGDVDGGDAADLSNIVIRRGDNDDDGSYVFIDDVSLTEFDPCSSICLESKFSQPITFRCCGDVNDLLPNAIEQNRPYNFIVDNATEVTLTTWDRWGGLVNEIKHYDPNGLKFEFDPQNVLNGQFDFFRFLWKGKDLYGNYIPANTVLVFQLSLKNCGYTRNFDGTITVLGANVSDRIDPIFANNEVNISCCPNEFSIDNVTCSSAAVYSANQKLSVATIAAVSINNGAEVKYSAGNEIEIGPNFDVEYGSLCDIFIGKCNVEGYDKKGNTNRGGSGFIVSKSASLNYSMPDMILEDRIKSINEQNVNSMLKTDFEIIPNPSSENVVLCKFEHKLGDNAYNIKIMNSVGKIIKDFEAVYSESDNGILLNGMKELVAGSYYVNIKGGNTNIISKLILISK